MVWNEENHSPGGLWSLGFASRWVVMGGLFLRAEEGLGGRRAIQVAVEGLVRGQEGGLWDQEHGGAEGSPLSLCDKNPGITKEGFQDPWSAGRTKGKRRKECMRPLAFDATSAPKFCRL